MTTQSNQPKHKQLMLVNNNKNSKPAYLSPDARIVCLTLRDFRDLWHGKPRSRGLCFTVHVNSWIHYETLKSATNCYTIMSSYHLNEFTGFRSRRSENKATLRKLQHSNKSGLQNNYKNVRFSADFYFQAKSPNAVIK